MARFKRQACGGETGLRDRGLGRRRQNNELWPLFWTPWDDKSLAITEGETAHLFDVETETFALLPAPADKSGIKSINRDPRTGRVIFTQATRGDFATELRSLDAPPVKITGLPLYKTRWNQPTAWQRAD